MGHSTTSNGYAKRGQRRSDYLSFSKGVCYNADRHAIVPGFAAFCDAAYERHFTIKIGERDVKFIGAIVGVSDHLFSLAHASQRREVTGNSGG